MFVPTSVVARSDGSGPPACRPFTFYSNVCIGDLIAIIACSIAGIGFVFWGIHAIRKMSQFPFNYPPDNKEEFNGEGERVDRYNVPSTLDNSPFAPHGSVQIPSLPDRVQTRLALSEPEVGIHRLSTPISNQGFCGQRPMNTPRTPLPAGGRSRRTVTRSSGHHGSLQRSERYGERNRYGVNTEHIRNVSPSRARVSPLGRSGGGYGHMNGDPTYGYSSK